MLSRIVARVRDVDGAVPAVPAYDTHEKVWLPPMPWLFQYPRGGEHRRMTPQNIRRILHRAVAGLDRRRREPAPDHRHRRPHRRGDHHRRPPLAAGDTLAFRLTSNAGPVIPTDITLNGRAVPLTTAQPENA
ncbi:hypothetical protein ACPA54_34775 [Uniformispora flossi]|uniref:hypothetical protein n=1 Tax=Uniformispora flossi TaxID=3390723 RepID=UPI003C2FFF8D